MLCVAPDWTFRDSNAGRSKRAFGSHESPERLLGPHGLLFIGNRRLYTRGKAAGTCIDHSVLSILLQRLRISGTILLIPSMPSWQTLVQL